MLEYRAAGAELQKIPEFSTAHKPLALQARIIQGGEALKSTNIDLPDLKPDSLIAQWQTSSTATLNKLSHVVTKEQHRVWADDTEKRKKAGTSVAEIINKQQVEDWSKKMVVFFGKQERKKNLDTLQNVHFGGIDYGNFSQDTAKQIYQKYMIDRDEMGESGNEILVIGKEIELPANMVRFINDALRAHLTDPKTVNFTELENNLEAIKTLALIFGKPSAEIIDNTLKGIISIFKNVESRKEFAAQANERKPVIDEKGDTKETSRQNYLYSVANNEKGLLEWLNDESDVETKVVQAVPQSPAKAVAVEIPASPAVSVEAKPSAPTTPKSGEYTAEEMTKFVQAQEALINLVKLPENKKQQDLVLEKLPELFNQIPPEFRIPILFYEDSLLVLAGLKPVFSEKNWLIPETYDPKIVQKTNEVLSQLGVQIEINKGKTVTINEKTGKKGYEFVIYNPQSLESYTKANADISPPYSPSNKFYDWNEQTAGLNPILSMGIKHGYPVSSILDNINGVSPLDNISSYNEEYSGRKNHPDIQLREQEKKNFFEKYGKMMQTNPKLQGSSPEMLEATKAWRIFIELDRKTENLPPTQTPLDTFYKERFEKINSRLDLLRRRSELSQDPQKNALEITQLDQQLNQLGPEAIKAQTELFAFEDVVLSELFGLSMHEIDNKDEKKAAYEEHLQLPMLSFLDAYYRRDLQAAAKFGLTLKTELKPTLFLLEAKINYEEEQFGLLIADHTRIAETHAQIDMNRPIDDQIVESLKQKGTFKIFSEKKIFDGKPGFKEGEDLCNKTISELLGATQNLKINSVIGAELLPNMSSQAITFDLGGEGEARLGLHIIIDPNGRISIKKDSVEFHLNAATIPGAQKLAQTIQSPDYDFHQNIVDYLNAKLQGTNLQVKTLTFNIGENSFTFSVETEPRN